MNVNYICFVHPHWQIRHWFTCSSICALQPFFRKSHPQFRASFACSFRLFFRSSSTSSFSSSSPSFLLAISFAASASYPYASVSLLLTDRARYLLPAATAAKLKTRTRVYTFRARLFTPCITMHAHVRIILSRVIHYQPILRASLEKIRKL